MLGRIFVTVMEDLSIPEVLDLLEKVKTHLTPEHGEILLSLAKFASRSQPEDAEKPEINVEGVDMMGNLREEIRNQLVFITQLRERITTDSETGQQVAPQIKDLRALQQTTSALFSMYTKLNEEITNQDRLHLIEKATIAAIRDLPGKTQQVFFSALEQLLKEQQ